MKYIIPFPTIDLVQTGENINKIRQSRGISVKELQMLFGFATPQAIYKWQHGLSLPTIDNLVVLSKALGVGIDDLLVLEDKA